jgi:peptide/nickel transport system substrate-binding protein
LAALKRGEIDIAYQIRGELARDVQRTSGLTLRPLAQGTQWLDFPEQWDANSPWHDPRVRLVGNRAIDRESINQALSLGCAHVTGSIIPDDFDFYWAPPAPVYDPAEARKRLAEAGYANGFGAGEYFCIAVHADTGEAVLDNLREVGIRARLRLMETAAFIKAWGEKKLRNIVQAQSGGVGNTATRLELFVVKAALMFTAVVPTLMTCFSSKQLS